MNAVLAEEGVYSGRATTLGFWNVKEEGMFGLKGDGTSSDSARLEAAFANPVTDYCRRFFFPRGTYRLLDVNCELDDVELIGEPGTIFQVESGAGPDLSLINFTGTRITIRCIRFVGDEYVSFGDTIRPHTLVQIVPDTEAEHVVFEDVDLVGGRTGLYVRASQYVSGRNIYCKKNYTRGMSIGAPPTSIVTIDGFTAEDVGVGEGLGIGATDGDEGDFGDISLTNVKIFRCGRLDPTPANWQEGLEISSTYIQRVQLSVFEIVDCGNGGIELKTHDEDPPVPAHLYQDIQIGPGRLQANADSVAGIAMNRNDGTDETKARRITVSNVDFVFDNSVVAAPTTANAVSILDYSNVTLSNLNMFGPWTIYVNIGASGTDDETASNIVLDGVKGIDGTAVDGVRWSRTVEKLHLLNCDFDVTSRPASRSGSDTALVDALIQGGSYKTSGAVPAIEFEGALTNLRMQGVLAYSAGSYALSCTDMDSASGRVINCDLETGHATQAPVNLNGTGTLEVFSNSLRCNDNARGITGTMTILAGDNKRGFKSSPATAGALGDVWLAPSPTAGACFSVCTAAGGAGAATWTAI